MGRRRKSGHNLPAGVYRKHGAYYLVQQNKWTRLGTELAESLREYSKLIGARDPQTLAQLLDKFILEHASKKKPKTLEMYSRCAALLKPIVVEFRPEQFSAREVIAVVKAIGRKHGKTTANQCRATLSAAYTFAIDEGLAVSNAVRDTKKLPVPKRVRYVETDELAAIEDAGSPIVGAVIDLAYVTGQRISDVLNFGIVDEESDAEHLVFAQVKTGHRMKLRRAEALEEAVQRAQSLCKELRWKNFREVEPETLIHNRKGAPYTYDGFSTLWQKARARSGVEDARIHDIRAKAVTDAEELGMNAQMLAGHASRLTTERYLRGRKAFIADPLPALLRPRKKAKKSAKSAAPKASKAASKRRAGDGFRGIDSVAPRRRNLRQEPEY